MECTAKLKTNEANLFQGPGNVGANSSQRNAHTQTQTQNFGVRGKEKKEFYVEEMRKQQEIGNIQNMRYNMLYVVHVKPLFSSLHS